VTIISCRQMCPEPSKNIICISPIHRDRGVFAAQGSGHCPPGLPPAETSASGRWHHHGQLLHGLVADGCAAPAWFPEGQAHRIPVLLSRLVWQPDPSLGTGASPVPAACVLWISPLAPQVGTDGSCQSFSSHLCFLSRQLVACLQRTEQNILLSPRSFSASPPSSEPVPPFCLCRSHFCSGIVSVPSISILCQSKQKHNILTARETLLTAQESWEMLPPAQPMPQSWAGTGVFELTPDLRL